MRYAIVDAIHDLGVDQQKLDSSGRPCTRLAIREFIHTDLPEPVEPAMSMHLAYIGHNVLPADILPRQTVSLLADSLNSGEIRLLVYRGDVGIGDSMPMAALPGWAPMHARQVNLCRPQGWLCGLLYARVRLQLVAGDGRPAAYVEYLHFHAEALEGVYKLLGAAL